MEVKASIANDIEASAKKAKYDKYVKQLLANKEILAWILHYCVVEFKELSIKEIIPCIENNIEIGERNVEPGLSNTKIHGYSNENNIINEGKITYDIIFYAKPKNDDSIEIIINVEAQNDYNPGYDIETRGLFYCARMLSMQVDREFSLAKKEYKKIKKVYSIWICTNSPFNTSYTISSYDVNHKVLYGKKDIKVGRYDLLEVVIIRLGEDIEKGNELHKMLSVLLSSKISSYEKQCRLKDDFEIEMAKELKQEVDKMCNLGDGIERKAIEETLYKNICNLMDSLGCSFEKAADLLKISSSEKDMCLEMLNSK